MVDDDGSRRALSLTARASASVGWLTAQTWVAKIGGFVTMVFLARLLTPADFGLVAVAMSVLPLVYLIADLGFGTYLLQADSLEPVAVRTAFWYSMGAGAVLCVGLMTAAPALEAMFGIPGSAAVIMAVSPAVLFVSLGSVPTALLRRGMRFRALSVQNGVAAIAAQVVAIVMALAGAGVWALVAQMWVAQLIGLAGAWIVARWRPARGFSWRWFRRMAGFGTSVMAVNGVALAHVWAENAIVSNVLGASALGQLSVAQRLVQTTQDLAGSAIAPVSTVVFAQVRSDADRLRRGYDRALSLTFVLIAPAMTTVAVTAPVLVPFLFGPQWTASIAVAQALAVAAVFAVGAMLDHGLFYGLGLPGRWLSYAVVVDAGAVVVTAIVVRWGVQAVALGFLAVAVLAAVARWFLVSHALGVHTWAIARRTLAVVVVGAVAGFAGWAVATLAAALPAPMVIGATGATVFAVQLSLSWFFFRGAVVELGRLVRARLPRRSLA